MSKMTVELSPKLDQIVNQLAEEQSVPKAQVVRRALALLSYLEKQADEGGEIVVRKGDEEKVIVFNSAF